MSVEARLKSLSIELPKSPSPLANYVPFVITGNLLYLSGQGPREADGTFHTGKVGQEVTIEQAYQDARLTGLNLLAVMQGALGELDRIERVVKLLGMVNGTPDFLEHPQVINGCSDLMVEVFEEKGRHARSAVGMGSLPNNITVEVEAIVEIRV
jgi:enamine deaminase RidA (YjgF/YER057c/UK114 family)